MRIRPEPFRRGIVAASTLALLSPAVGVLGDEPGASSRPLPGQPSVRIITVPGPAGPTTGPQVSDPAAGVIETFAGGSSDGGDPGASTFFQPWDGLVAPDGSIVVVDSHSHRIRAYDPDGGPVRTIAGTGDAGFSGDGGPATQASLNFPMGAVFGPDGDLYIGDTWNDRIRRVDAATGVISTIAGVGPGDDPDNPPPCGAGEGGLATEAVICNPRVMVVADNGDVYVGGGGEVLRIDAATGILSRVAGKGQGGFSGDGGPATAAGMPYPTALALDAAGNLLVAHQGHRIRYINFGNEPATVFPAGPSPVVVEPGSIRTIVGNGQYARNGDEGDGGPAPVASITSVENIGIAADGDLLLADDDTLHDGVEDKVYRNMLVRRVDWRTGIIHTIAGNHKLGVGEEDVPARTTSFAYPIAAFEHADDVLVVDRGNSRLRRIRAGRVRTEAGARVDDRLPAPRAQLCSPGGVASAGGVDYISDNCNLRIRAVGDDGKIGSVAGSDPPCVFIGAATYGCEGGGGDGGPAVDASLAPPGGIAASGDGLVAFATGYSVRIVNTGPSERTIFPQAASPLVLSPGEIELAAGNGDQVVPATGSIPGRGALIKGPRDVAFAPDGDLVIAEAGAHRILRLDSATGELSLVAGGAPLTPFDPLAHLDGPAGVARFFLPGGVAVASDGTIYVADTYNGRIRRIDAITGIVTTVAGHYYHGFLGDGGPATAALLAYPEGVSIAPNGDLIVADTMNHRIRKIDATTGIITTLAGSGPSSMDTLTCGSKYPCGHYGGDGGAATEARLHLPADAVVTADGRLLIADTYNNRVRVVPLS